MATQTGYNTLYMSCIWKVHFLFVVQHNIHSMSCLWRYKLLDKRVLLTHILHVVQLVSLL